MARPGIGRRPRLLLVAEAATFAHVARMTVLRRALRDEFDLQAAFDGRFDHHLDVEDRDHHPLFTVPTEAFVASVRRGRFPYGEAELTRYVEDDLRLLRSVEPELVIGDFRLSLALSCVLAKVPYLPLVNGYWTPECREVAIAPRIPLLRRLPRRTSASLFSLLRPIAFRLAVRPFERVARKFGVRGAGENLLEVYSQGSRALLAEPEGWLRLNDRRRCVPIGAVGWSSSRPLPDWWGRWDKETTVVHVSLGSSGDRSQIGRVCEVLGRRDDVVVVVAGESAPPRRVRRAMVYSSPFVNSRLALEQSQLFVSNGGSLSLTDALRSGCPVVGIASNYDQVLNMAVAERHGVGTLVFDDAPTRVLARSIDAWLERAPMQVRALERARALFSPGLSRGRLVETVRSALAA